MGHTHVDETKTVDRPKPPVLKSSPDHFDSEAFTVMHIGLGGIIAQNPIDNDSFLAKPELAAT